MLDFLNLHFGLATTGLGLLPILAAGAAIVCAYAVYGMTGFGSSIVAIPLLTQILPLRTATPMMLVLDLGAGLFIGARNRKAVQVRELRRITPWLTIGMLLGITALVSAPERPLELLLGVCLVIYSAWKITSKNEFKPLSAFWAFPLGLGGGCLTAMFGTGGPVYTIYLAGRLPDHEQRRATISMLITLTAFARLLLFSLSGLFKNPAVPALVIWLLPCGLAGNFAGAWLRTRVPAAYVAPALWSVLILAGGGLVVRAVIGLMH